VGHRRGSCPSQARSIHLLLTKIPQNEPYQFSHYLCISRTYRISEDDENAMEGVESTAPPAKRQKSAPNKQHGLRTYSYHQEDELWEKVRVLEPLSSSQYLNILGFHLVWVTRPRFQIHSSSASRCGIDWCRYGRETDVAVSGAVSTFGCRDARKICTTLIT
jgi:hypothetical protein